MNIILSGLASMGLAVSTNKRNFVLKVREQEIFLPHLPINFEGLKVVQISDLHLGGWRDNAPLEESVARINELEPDVIFITGDLVNRTVEEALPFKNILQQLKAPGGIYSVLGNHDYGDYASWLSPGERRRHLTRLISFQKSVGWKLLRNEHVMLQHKQDKLAIIGTDNWSRKKRFTSTGDLLKALKGTESADVRFLLSHDPSHWEHEVRNEPVRVDMTFAGHTHGLQIGLDNDHVRWSPAQYLHKYWAGLYSHPIDGTTRYLYVNCGLGSHGLPARIGIVPEVTLFRFYREKHFVTEA